MKRLMVSVGLLLLGVTGLSAQTVITIQELQCNWDSTYASVYVGQTVTVTGVVSAPFGSVASSRTLFIQDPAGGPCSGVMVYVPTSAGTPTVNPGDSVQVTGSVSEYFGNTEISVASVATDIVVLGQTSVPAPTVIATGILDTTSASSFFATQPDSAEAYEHVLIQVNGVVSNPLADSTRGDWEVTDGTGYALVRNNGNYTYTPNLGDPVQVAGIVHTYFGLYRIQPRNDSDVVAQVQHLSMAYARGQDQVDVIFAQTENPTDAQNVANYTLQDSAGNAVTIASVVQDPNNLKRVTLTTATPLQNGMLYQVAYAPIQETTAFYGLLTLAQIQSDTVPGDTLFGSNWDGKQVSVVVLTTADTSAVSFTSTNWAFFQDPGGGPWSGLMIYSPVAKSVLEGDSVLLVGQVSEYNGMTEIINIVYSEVLSSGAALTVDSIGTGVLANGGVNAEMYEGALVKVAGTITSVTGAQFSINDGSGGVVVNADTSVTSTLASGVFAEVTGVVRYTGGTYQLYLRHASEVGVAENGLVVHRRLLRFPKGPVTHGNLTVELALPARSRLNFTVTNALGRTVLSLDRTLAAGTQRITLPTAKLPSGLYFLRVEDGNRTLQRSFLRVR